MAAHHSTPLRLGRASLSSQDRSCGALSNSRRLASKLGRSAAEGVVRMFDRMGYVKGAALVSRGAWITGGIVAAVLAYRQTTGIGLRAVTESVRTRTEDKWKA